MASRLNSPMYFTNVLNIHKTPLGSPVSTAPDAITPMPDHGHCQLLLFTIALHLWTDKYRR